jgi:hypothetical protein
MVKAATAARARAARELPKLTPALIIEMTRLEIAREVNGEGWCCTQGIGRIRLKLGMRTIIARNDEAPIARAANDARAVLAEMCNFCGRDCAMKSFDISA